MKLTDIVERELRRSPLVAKLEEALGDVPSVVKGDALLGVLVGVTDEVVAAVPDGDVAAIVGELERIKLALSTRRTVSPTTGDGDRLLDVEEAAQLLGVSVDTLYRNWSTLPFSRKLSPRALRFSKKGIEKWIAQGGHL